MAHPTATHFKHLQRLRTTAILLVAQLVLCILGIPARAQDVLVGLNSNGGPEGKGTAFSIKTNGSNYSLIKSFADWGAAPEDNLIKGSDGNLYGTTPNGGTYNHGTIFRITNKGAITILRHLNMNVDGGYPKGSLVQATDGNFYGTATTGGVNNGGVIFRITPAGQYTIIRSLSINTDGGRPNGKLVQGKDGLLYGLNYGGGSAGYGTIFKINMDGSGYTVMKHFLKTDGANSYGGLVQASDGALYGMTYLGGANNDGVIFRITTGGQYSVLRSLNDADGIYPTGDLIQGKDGYLYGMAPNGGLYGGTIFRIKTDGTGFAVVRNLSAGVEGAGPKGTLMLASDGNFYGMAYSTSGGYGGSIFRMSSSGTVTVLRKLTPATEGSYPMGGLAQGSDGALYGMTNAGGKLANGTVFRITTAATPAFSVLAHFNGSAVGNVPVGNLALGKDSAYFGVAQYGGAFNHGAVFKICSGTTTLLYSFNRNTDGAHPEGSLARAADGNLYGTTTTGGANGYGTIYRISPTGSFRVLFHLKHATDGSNPMGSLVQAPDGYLYGTASAGGTGNSGTIFKIKPDGTGFAVVRALVPATDGQNPASGLTLKDGVLYGLTGYNPRFFKITADGQFTVLKTLNNSTDGSYPYGSLVAGTDGQLYGTFSSGGTNFKGSIFKISTAGVFTKLRNLNGTTDGGTPKGSLVRGTDGALYGTASTGGNGGVGTVFRLSGTSYTVIKHLNMATDGGNPTGGLVLAPVISLNAAAQNALSTQEDVSLPVTLSGTGAAGLTFSIVTPPQKGTISSGTGASRTYKPNANYYGKDSFAFTANFGCLASAPAWVKINVTPVNDAPVLDSIRNKSAVKGTALSFTATAKDVDAGQTKTFSLVSAPSGATIHASTGAFSWTPASAGTYNLTVRVTDNGSPILYDQETITVTVATTATAVTNAATENKYAGATQLQEASGTRASLFPNPVKDQFTLVPGSPVPELLVSIYDSKGSLVSTQSFKPAGSKQVTVDAAYLRPGQYFVQLKTGTTSETLKMVKQ